MCRLLENKRKPVVGLCFSPPCSQSAPPHPFQHHPDLTDMRRLLENKRKPVVGLCFSLPCSQTGLAEGKILHLTKRFENPGAVGMDPI